eukprot:m.14752 g.14752  ORF g.14752 m.14752 type:complete len:425 (+) comp10275_c0_seq2:53-1327(+)
MASSIPVDEIAQGLRGQTIMFSYLSPAACGIVASKFVEEHYKQGDVLIKQGDPQTKMFYLSTDSEVIRNRTQSGGVEKDIGQFGPASTSRTVGALHFMRNDPSYSTMKCVSPTCTAYTLTAEAFKNTVLASPEMSEGVMYGLQKEIRRASKILERTPLLKQGNKPKTTQAPVLATSIAAAVESFYRSALNAYINAALTNSPVGKLLPDMHVQVPIRVLYINGTKGVRTLLNRYVDPEKFQFPNLVSIGILLAPGLTMTPVSSVLEAANAGHKNPKPLSTRWIDGIGARSIREIIFAIGLNQMSDYAEERVPAGIEHGLLRNSIGSLVAGVLAGYFSHVPHNLSALKLMNPDKTYKVLYGEYAKANESRVPASWSASSKRLGANVLGIIWPNAVLVRTTQIIGTFMILNGTIFMLKDHVPSLGGF